jgi:hypothetical protein
MTPPLRLIRVRWALPGPDTAARIRKMWAWLIAKSESAVMHDGNNGQETSDSVSKKGIPPAGDDRDESGAVPPGLDS